LRRVGILISGRGSNMESLIKAGRRGEMPDVEIAVVISNVSGAAGLEKARQLGVETIVLDNRGKKREEHDRAVARELRSREVDLVCLAGYMRLLSPWFIREFPAAIVNIHPSLLPAFPGLHVHEQVLEYGVKFSGCTVHFVDEELDHGAIIAQAAVPVLDEDSPDSLAARVLMQEHLIYPIALQRVASKSLRLDGRRVLPIG
jgi:phosphoribosylglycinamide formyltransferase-1